MTEGRPGAEMQLRVADVRREADDVVALDLADPAGAPLPPFTPGSHIALRLGCGLVRQYSLCNGPDDVASYRIAVKREADSRGGSRAVHLLRKGDLVPVAPPVNAFPVDWTAPHLVLLAGGIGITPLLSMARHALRRGHSFELHYFARSPRHAAFHDALRAGDLSPHLELHLGIEAGRVDARLRGLLESRRAGSHLYLCGPRPFMDTARAIAAACAPIAETRWEYFAPSEPAGEAPGGDAAFEVRLSRSGQTFEVPPGKTILQVLLENGIVADCSCMEGICGICVTRVLEGEPDHRDEFLTEEEKRPGDQMTICVSRARSRLLVLDL